MKNHIIKALAISVCSVLLALALTSRLSVAAEDSHMRYSIWYHSTGWDAKWTEITSDDDAYLTDYWAMVFRCVQNWGNYSLQTVQTMFFSIDGFEDYYTNYDKGFEPEFYCNVYYVSGHFYIMFLRSTITPPSSSYIYPNSSYIEVDGLSFSGTSFTDYPYASNILFSIHGFSNSWFFHYYPNASFSDILPDANGVSNESMLIFDVVLDSSVPDASSTLSYMDGVYTDRVWFHSPVCSSFPVLYADPEDGFSVTRNNNGKSGIINTYTGSETLYFDIDSVHVYSGVLVVPPDVSPSVTPEITPEITPEATPTLNLTPPISFTSPSPVHDMPEGYNPFESAGPLFGFLLHSYTVPIADGVTLNLNPLFLIVAIFIISMFFNVFLGGRNE